MKTNANLTIYNKYTDPTSRSEKYQRTQIISPTGFSVLWENRKAANTLVTGGNIATDQASIYIPFLQGENFLPSTEWQALVTKTGKWTLQTGDFVVKGLVTDEIQDTVTDPETHEITPAFTISLLKEKYQDVLSITSVDTMDQGSLSMKHWQLGAK